MRMIRIQFELPEDKVKELEGLMRETQIATRKDLFNNALTLFEWTVKERKSGNIIASIDEKKGVLKELAMLSLSSITPNEEEEENNIVAATAV